MKISKKEIITFSIIFVFTLIIFYQFLDMHYATDTYVLIEKGYYEYALNGSLAGGRAIMCVIGLVAGMLHIPVTAYVISTLVIALFISCVSVLVIKNIILQHKRRKIKEHTDFTNFIYYNI